MKSLEFDEDKSFEENLENFLQFLNDEDQEMANIMISNITHLIGATSESERNSARIKFNESVLKGLENMITNEEKPKV